VYCARKWVGNEPFLLLLGDHLYLSNSSKTCTQQLLEIYENYQTNTLGLKVIDEKDLEHFGCVTGRWEDKNAVLNITEIYEKPNIEYAKEHLHMDQMEDNKYLALSGQYILSPKIFDYLEYHIKHNIRERGEIQLTSCLEELRKEEGFIGYIIKGKSFDIGMPAKYRETIIAFGKKSSK